MPVLQVNKIIGGIVMIVSTTSTLQGHEIAEYKGIVSGDPIIIKGKR